MKYKISKILLHRSDPLRLKIKNFKMFNIVLSKIVYFFYYLIYFFTKIVHTILSLKRIIIFVLNLIKILCIIVKHSYNYYFFILNFFIVFSIKNITIFFNTYKLFLQLKF